MLKLQPEYLKAFLDSLESHHHVTIRALLKPLDEEQQVYQFGKFVLGPEPGVVREIINGKNYAISALSYESIENADHDHIWVTFGMHVRTPKSVGDEFGSSLAIAGLYSRRYIVLPKSFGESHMMICREKCQDIVLTYNYPEIKNHIDPDTQNESPNIVCGTLLMEEAGKLNAYLKYASYKADKHRSANTAILAAYIAVKSLID